MHGDREGIILPGEPKKQEDEGGVQAITPGERFKMLRKKQTTDQQITTHNLGGSSDARSRISVNTQVYKEFGIKTRSEVPVLNDSNREIPMEEEETKQPEPFFGSQLMMTRLQSTIKDKMVRAKPDDGRIEVKPADSDANLTAAKKISIYDLLKTRQAAKSELMAKRQATLVSAGRSQVDSN